ncbi:MAG: YihY family inner membrane protein [Deltaproteobacteria bacterium]|nr:YihY family inner membrane protein [Deltaproteobacteria bacterium]
MVSTPELGSGPVDPTDSEGTGARTPRSAAKYWLGRARHFIEQDLWSYEPRRFERSSRLLLLLVRSVAIVLYGVTRDQLRLRAAALTYTTLLSIVPALTVVFSTFTAFGGLDQAGMRDRLISYFSAHQQESVKRWLDDLVINVNFGALGGLGVGLLVVTTLLLLAEIERALNEIWGIDRDRTWARKFLAYWPLVSLGPILFGVSLTATASLEASPAVQRAIELVPALHLAFKIGPLMLTWSGFTLMYMIMPNTRVPARFAIIGGVVGGSLWEAAKVLFAFYAGRAISYSALYGSLGVVPLTIVWIYVSWLVSLSGALVTFAVQNAKSYEPTGDRFAIGARAEERLAVALTVAVFARFEQGLGPSDVEALAERVAGPPRTMGRILRRLVAGRVLIELSDSNGDSYAPGRPSTVTSVADVLAVMRAPPLVLGEQRPAPPPEVFHAHPEAPETAGLSSLDRADELVRVELGQVTMAQLIQEKSA